MDDRGWPGRERGQFRGKLSRSEGVRPDGGKERDCPAMESLGWDSTSPVSTKTLILDAMIAFAVPIGRRTEKPVNQVKNLVS